MPTEQRALTSGTLSKKLRRGTLAKACLSPIRIRRFPRQLCHRVKQSWNDCVDPTKKPVGKPGAGNPHAGFDERGWETGPRALCSEHPRPSSTLLS